MESHRLEVLPNLNFKSSNIWGFGAGIYSLSSDTFISNCYFGNNNATNGAAIYFDCSDATYCNYSISNSVFSNNSASLNGASF